MNSKLALFLAGLASSSLAYAGHPVDEPMLPPSVPVTIPQQIDSWAVGIEGLYLEPTNGEFNYARDLYVATNPFANKTVGVDQSHDWAGHIDIAYLFMGNGRDVSLGWTHLHAKEVDSYRKPTDTLLIAVGGPAPIGLPGDAAFTNGWDYGRGKSDNDYNDVDLVFGQKMAFWQDKVTLRAFGGIRFADIDMRDKSIFFADALNAQDDVLRASTDFTLRSDFQGAGPRAGLDAKVRLTDCFSLTGTIAGSMIVGDLDQKYRAVSTIQNLTLFTETTTNINRSVSDNYRVVPELDSRLGVNMAHWFTDETGIEFEIGYHVMNYFGPKDNSFVGYVDSMNYTNDFGLHGPYARVQVNIA